MAKTKTKEPEKKIKLTDMTPAELADKAQQLADQLTKLKLENTVGKLTNKRQLFNIRKEIARVKTVLNVKIKSL